MINQEDIIYIGGGIAENLVFDLSIINKNLYEPLYHSLKHWIPKNACSLNFVSKRENCDNKTFNESISQNHVHYIQNLVNMLFHSLSKTVHLHSLAFDSIQFSSADFCTLINAIKKCLTIQQISFSNIMFTSDMLQNFCKNKFNDNLHSISLKGCSLKTTSVPLIIECIKNNTAIQVFDVTDEEIGPDGVESINKTLRMNHFSQAPFHEKLNTTTSSESDDIVMSELMRENQSLREELRELIGKLKIKKCNEDTYIIGKESENFVQFMKTINQKLDSLES